MTPTMKLRFVKRKVEVNDLDGPPFVREVKILQQWWAEQEISIGWATLNPSNKGEWRDVPVEDEK